MRRYIHGIALFGAGMIAALVLMQTGKAQDDRLTGIRINHVGIFAKDWDETINFYTKTLGFKEAFTFKDKDGNVTTSYIQMNKENFLEIARARAWQCWEPGRVGLSAIQGARIQGAARIIAIEPIRARRELALRLGATVALDPNVEGSGLVAKVRELCQDAATRKLLGGRDRTANGDSGGADFVIATVGADFAQPAVERGPDPTGLQPTRQAWEMTRAGGRLVTLGVPRGDISLPAGAWSNRGRIHHAGQYGGVNAKSDVPRFVQLIDMGKFDAKALVTSTYPLERSKEAFQAVADRTTVGAVVVFT